MVARFRRLVRSQCTSLQVFTEARRLGVGQFRFVFFEIIPKSSLENHRQPYTSTIVPWCSSLPLARLFSFVTFAVISFIVIYVPEIRQQSGTKLLSSSYSLFTNGMSIDFRHRKEVDIETSSIYGTKSRRFKKSTGFRYRRRHCIDRRVFDNPFLTGWATSRFCTVFINYRDVIPVTD